MRYTRDRSAYNHMGYTQDSNLTNPKPNPNPNPKHLTLTETLVRRLVWFVLIELITNANRHFDSKEIIISVGRLLICIVVLRTAKTDRSCRTVLRITSA